MSVLSKFTFASVVMVLLATYVLPAAFAQAGSPSGPDPAIFEAAGLDPARVMQLRRREMQGDGLDAADQAYLQKAKAVLQDQHKGEGQPPDRERDPTGTRGDGQGELMLVPAIQIPESKSPVRILRVRTSDGESAEASYRLPAGDGPFPVVIFIHGGLRSFEADKRRESLLKNPVMTRFLQRGWAVVQATFRDYHQDPQDEGPILDGLAIMEAVAKLPAIDEGSVVLYGGSGGGSIALDMAARARPAAVVAGEPATLLFTGMLTTGDYGPRLAMMADPQAHFTDDHRKRTLVKLKRIKAPLLILHGDQHDLRIMNLEIFQPLLREAGLRYQFRIYSQMRHGFYMGHMAPESIVEEVVNDSARFAVDKVKTKPVPWWPPASK